MKFFFLCIFSLFRLLVSVGTSDSRVARSATQSGARSELVTGCIESRGEELGRLEGEIARAGEKLGKLGGKLTKMRPSAETVTPVAWLGKCAASSSRNGPGLEDGGGEAGARACDWARTRPAASVASAKLPASMYRRWTMGFSR